MAEFRRRVPVRSYKDLAPYIDAIFIDGEPDVLWPGRVTTFADFLVGNITGVSIANMRWYHDIFRTPDRQTALIPNWEERLQRMAELTVGEDIVHLAGMPTWIQCFGEIVQQVSGKSTLRAVWPNLLAVIIGGVSPTP